MDNSGIQEYFKEYIFGFIFNDIRNCIKAKANYTVALALLSYTEFLGGLISGTLGLTGESKNSFNEGLKFFDFNDDTQYYKNFKLRIRDVDLIEKDVDIYGLFRCGLAHEYFIKADSRVLNNPDGWIDDFGIFYVDGCINSDVGVKVIEGKLVFHNNAFFRDFTNAWKKYFDKLIITKDFDLLTKFNNSIARVSVRDLRIK